MIELAKDMLFFMLLLPFLLMALVMQVLLEAILDWWGNMRIPSPCRSDGTDQRTVASAELAHT
jgi:hypothetical protein